MTKKIFYLLLIFTFTNSFAQESKGVIGLRFGYGWGLSGKYFLDRNGNALEFTVKQGVHGALYNTSVINFGTAYQKHFDIDKRGKWLVYVGAGGNIGFGKNAPKQAVISGGIAPVIGLDFWTQNLVVPFNLSIDYAPTFYYDRITKIKKNDFSVSYLNFNVAVRVGLGRL